MDVVVVRPLKDFGNHKTTFTNVRWILFFVLLVIIVGIVAIATMWMVVQPAKDILNNSGIADALEEELRLAVADAGTPEAMLKAFKKIESGQLLNVDDPQATYPPHPSFADMLSVTDEANPWLIPSESAEKGERLHRTQLHATHHTDRAYAATDDNVKNYLKEVTGQNLKDAILKFRDTVDDKELYDKVFLDSDDDVGTLTQSVSGHCNQPVKIANADVDCYDVCVNHNARKIKAPFATGSHLITPLDPSVDEFYCWSGNDVNNDKTLQYQPPSTHVTNTCSMSTAHLVLTNDGGWQCRPMYPTIFGGRDGTLPTACEYDPRVHGIEEVDYLNTVNYIDFKSKAVIANHSEFAIKSTFIQLIKNTTSIAEYKLLCADPDLYFNNPIVCLCAGVTDYLNNPIDSSDWVTRKFSGSYECRSNPCYMTSVADNFGKFDGSNGWCLSTPDTPAGTLHAIAGDRTSPMVGPIPALGVELALPQTRIDYNIDETATPSEANARLIAKAAAPVIPSQNITAKDVTRHTLYVPVPSMTLHGTLNVTARPSALLHRSCMPPVMSTQILDQFRPPLVSASFFMSPVADVLAGYVPQKPYEHDLLISESLRRSRLISGNVFGGSELLYSNLLASRKSNEIVSSKLARIRNFYETFMTPRRLSQSEYVHLRETIGSDSILQQVEKYNRWDTHYRKYDFEHSNIQTTDEAFVLREGLMLRTYGPYCGVALLPSFFDTRKLNRPNSPKLNDINFCPLNPWQMTIPTSQSLYTSDTCADDHQIFDVAALDIFRRNTDEPVYKLFNPNKSNYLSKYTVGTSELNWGLNKFRFDDRPKDGPFVTMDRRLEFDYNNLNSTTKQQRLLPLSLFKISPLEWGHPMAEIETGEWLKINVDTQRHYQKMIKETSIVQRPMWYMPAWEKDAYYLLKNY